MQDTKLTFNPWRTLIALLIISVFFENMMLISVAGTSFKPTHIVFMLAILLGISQRYVKKRDALIGIFLLLLPCFPLYRISDTMEWFKSYIIYVIMVCFLVFAFGRFVEEFRADYKRYIKLFIAVVALTQVLGIIQFICMNFYNYFFLRGIFGSLEYHKNIYNMSNGFYRAYSVYHEPSFFGLVTLSGIAALFAVGKEIYGKLAYYCLLAISVLSVFVSLSASCLIIFLVLLIMQTFLKDSSSIAKIASIIALGIVLIVMSLSTTLLSPVMRLFTEVNSINSSGYERINTQLMYVQKTLQYYPFLGRGIGQEGNVDSVGIVGLYSAMNNALAGVIVNFGMSSLFITVPLIIKAIKNVTRNVLWLPIIFCIIGIYASTGAYISVDTFNMVVILLAIGNSIEYISNQAIMEQEYEQ